MAIGFKYILCIENLGENINALHVTQTFRIGPRKITRWGKNAGVYLGKDFTSLIGKKALITVEILEEIPDHPGPKIKEKLT